jgi:hypothetical protein
MDNSLLLNKIIKLGRKEKEILFDNFIHLQAMLKESDNIQDSFDKLFQDFLKKQYISYLTVVNPGNEEDTIRRIIENQSFNVNGLRAFLEIAENPPENLSPNVSKIIVKSLIQSEKTNDFMRMNIDKIKEHALNSDDVDLAEALDTAINPKEKTFSKQWEQKRKTSTQPSPEIPKTEELILPDQIPSDTSAPPSQSEPLEELTTINDSEQENNEKVIAPPSNENLQTNLENQDTDPYPSRGIQEPIETPENQPSLEWNQQETAVLEDLSEIENQIVQEIIDNYSDLIQAYLISNDDKDKLKLVMKIRSKIKEKGLKDIININNLFNKVLEEYQSRVYESISQDTDEQKEELPLNTDQPTQENNLHENLQFLGDGEITRENLSQYGMQYIKGSNEIDIGGIIKIPVILKEDNSFTPSVNIEKLLSTISNFEKINKLANTEQDVNRLFREEFFGPGYKSLINEARTELLQTKKLDVLDEEVNKDLKDKIKKIAENYKFYSKIQSDILGIYYKWSANSKLSPKAVDYILEVFENINKENVKEGALPSSVFTDNQINEIDRKSVV